MNPGQLQLPAASGSTALLIALVTIAFGLLNCFFGYRIFRVLLGLYGLVLGAFVGLTVAANVSGGQTLWLIVGAIVGGLVGAALMVLLYFVGVFLVGAAAGALLTNAIGAMLGFDMPTLVVIIVAVVVGVIALIAQRLIIILATAFGGAWLAVSGGMMLFTGESLPGLGVFTLPATWERATVGTLIILAAWLVLAIAGTVVQFRTTVEGEAAPASGPVRREPRDQW